MTVNDWIKRNLGELVNIQGGFAFKSTDFVDDGVPIVRMSDLNNGSLDLEGAVRIAEQKMKYLSNFALNDGDFLIGMSGSIENYAIVRKNDLPAYLNQRVGRFRLFNAEFADYDFVTQVSRSDPYKLHVESLSAGAAQLNISPKQIQAFCFDVPPKPEQTKIAEILSTVDRAIEQTEALIAKQQRIKTGLMQDLLTRGIDEHGNLRSEQTHQFKDSPLGRIPVEWEVKALSDLVDEDITYGIVQAGPHIENGVPYIRTGDMAGDAIDVETLLRTSKQIAESYKRSTVYCGDTVFALRATVGKVLPVTEEINGANLTQGTAKISPKDSIDSKFILWVMRSSKVQDVIRVELKGTTFMEITLGELRRVKLILPKKKSEQTMISEKLEKHDCLRRCYERRRGKLCSLKTALMQDLLTGKKRVTPLLDEEEETA